MIMKRNFLILLTVIFFGTVGAFAMPPGPYYILHKEGAIYDSNNGWNLNTPPYYAGTEWAVDFVFNSQGLSILHKDGAIWNSTDGWVTTSPPYYAGTEYARALEYLRDLTGCWGVRTAGFTAEDDEPDPGYELYRNVGEFPYIYLDVQGQTGTRFWGNFVNYDLDDNQCYYEPFEGTIIGDHVTIVAHFTETYGGEQYEISWTAIGLVFWNSDEQRWEIKGAYMTVDFWSQQGDAGGGWGNFIAWPEQNCSCPPQ